MGVSFGDFSVKQARLVEWADVGGREASLVQRCASGEEAAYSELVADHQRMVVQLAVNLLGDRDEALDLSQEVFLKVFRTIHRFRGQSSLRTWIYRIAVNQARNRHRFWRRRHRADQVSLDAHVAAHGEFLSGGLSRPDRVLAQKELASRLQIALDHLPFDQRTAIVLREVDGLSYDEIAFSLGVAVGHGQVSPDARAPGLAARAQGSEDRMKALTCAATRRRLAAFHDEELAVADQIAVSAHLDWCSACAEEFAELRTLQAALRGTSPGRVVLADHEDATFEAAVLSRMNAEETLSFDTQVREMFEDMHLVYAGLGAAVAAMVCVVIMLGMMRVATAEEPDSLAAMMRMLASPPPRVDSPGTNQNPVGLYPDVRMPRALDELFFATSSGAGTDDTVFTLTAVVTREGRVANLEMLRASRVGAPCRARCDGCERRPAR